MEDFVHILRREVEDYDGFYAEMVQMTPEVYCLLTNLLEHPDMPKRLRPLLCCAIAYFIAPEDAISEELLGPYGYVDDVYFGAYATMDVLKLSGNENLIRESWQSEGDGVALTKDIVENRRDALASKTVSSDKTIDFILDYTGYRELRNMLED